MLADERAVPRQRVVTSHVAAQRIERRIDGEADQVQVVRIGGAIQPRERAIGVAEPVPRERMFNLELAQRWLVNDELQRIVPDPDRPQAVGDAELRRIMEAVIEDRGASTALRKHVAGREEKAA